LLFPNVHTFIQFRVDLIYFNIFVFISIVSRHPLCQTSVKQQPKKQEKADHNTKATKEGVKDNAGRPVSAAGRGGKNQRPFDRRSGTGRNKDVAKSGAGKFGWGSEKDVVEHAEAGAAAAASESAADSSAPAVEEVKAEPQYTFLELLAQKAKVADSVNEARGASKETVAAAAAVEVSRKEKKRQVLSLDEFVGPAPAVQAKPVEEQPRDSENRGSFRGRGGNAFRGSSRGGRGGARVNMNDQHAFPALGQ
jgi:plasminogen activator inhibitor 1 RNA-binding protein